MSDEIVRALPANSEFQRLLRRITHLACLHMRAVIEWQYTGRAGADTLAWARVRPRMAGPKGRLP